MSLCGDRDCQRDWHHDCGLTTLGREPLNLIKERSPQIRAIFREAAVTASLPENGAEKVIGRLSRLTRHAVRYRTAPIPILKDR